MNLDLALDTARLVIICVPLAELRQAMADIGRLLEPDGGAVVTAITPLVVPTQRWADELLPRGYYYVAGDIFLAPGMGGWEPLRGPDDAQADLFTKAIYTIVTQDSTHPGAVRAITDLAWVLGAEPYYMDADEHDAVRVFTESVPDLVATALFTSVNESPGWEEVRRAAGRSFATATAAAAGDPASRRMLMQLGSDALLRGISIVLEKLAQLQSILKHGDIDTLERILSTTSHSREKWFVESLSRDWQQKPEAVEHDSLFERTVRALMGEGLAGKH
jgi:prephenate dehydrogenase